MILVNLEGGTVLETALAIVLRLLDFVSYSSSLLEGLFTVSNISII